MVVTGDNRAAIPLLLLVSAKHKGRLHASQEWGGAWHLCCHQMNQLGGTVKYLITCMSALF